MASIKKTACLFALLILGPTGYCQPAASGTPEFSLIVLNKKSQPAEGATVELLNDSKFVKAAITNAMGTARFENIADGAYTFSVTCIGYKPQITTAYHIPGDVNTATVMLHPPLTGLRLA